MALEQEISFFETHRSEYLKTNEGKFALIKGGLCFGFYDDAETAFRIGVEQYGAQAFLIKQVLPTDRIDVAPALACGLLNASV